MSRTQFILRRRGVTALLAMIYLVLFSVLAIGFYAATTISAQVVNNEIRSAQALLAAETGMEFVQYALHGVSIPPETTDDDVLLAVYQDLDAQLNSTGNFVGRQVDLIDDTIHMPVGANTYISAGGAGNLKFRAEITRAGRDLVVKVIGAANTSGGLVSASARRAGVELTYTAVERPTDFFRYGMASQGAVTILTKNPIVGDPIDQANVLSLATTNPPVTIGITSPGSGSGISGDIRVLEGTVPVVYPGWSVGGSTINGDIMTNHVHYIAPDEAPSMPMPNTSIYRPFATNLYVHGLGYYENVLIPPNTDPTFNAGTKIRGVVYIQQPNIVKFNGNVEITGVIVTEDLGVGSLASNQLIFSGNGGTKKGVEALPDEPQFAGLKLLGGSFIVAPGFDVQLTGNFGNLQGHITGDKVTLSGNSNSTMTGSLIALKSTLTVSGNTNLSLKYDPTQGHAGLRFDDRFIPDMSTYLEVVP